MGAERSKILCIVGTRPEAIKMAPVVHELRRHAELDVRLLLSGQHRHMAARALEAFGLAGDLELDAMRENQTLSGLTGRLFLEMEPILSQEAPAMVIAQGDTTTVMVTALSCFYTGIAFAHVEAGLRTGDLQNPFPEELNRVIAGRVARLNFAPTTTARGALLAEGVDPATVFVTGNTVIDALHLVRQSAASRPRAAAQPGRRSILMTIHRRENFGAPMDGICRGVVRVLDSFPDIDLVFPVHPNPNVRSIVQRHLAGHPRAKLLEPLGYEALVDAMSAAHLVLTDSGGIQEEAPALAKPVLVLRTATERPEAVEHGVARLIGTSEQALFSSVAELLTDEAAYRAMARGVSPYGDGEAARRIGSIVRAHLRSVPPNVDEFTPAERRDREPAHVEGRPMPSRPRSF